jgi:uncharacterized protein YkwD
LKGKTMMNFKTSVTAVAVALFVVACGGGGGGGSPATAPVGATPTPPVSVPAPAPVVTPADIQTSVPALTYAATSEEFIFVTAFNKFRADIGLGLLAQNSILDGAASKHLDYVLKNDVLNGGTVDMRTNDPITGRSMFHIEQSDKPLFSGIQEIDRAKVGGYRGSYVGEELSFSGGKGAQVAFDSLASTVYHRAGLMMQSVNDIGTVVGKDISQTLVMEIGISKAQTQAADFLGVFPAANQTGVGLHAGVEVPNPFPDLSLSNDDFPTKTGYPVTVSVKEGASIEVLTFTLTEAGAAVPLEARIMTRDNDPTRFLTSNLAFLVAKSALKPSTTYSVKFSGRVNNALVSKDWKFTTRS